MDISQIQAVFFDLDGTLVDTAPDMVACANRLRESEGLPPADPLWVRNHVSQGAAGVLRAAFPEEDDDARAARVEPFLDLYRQHLSVHSRLFDGMASLLDSLEAESMAWGVVTNKAEEFARPLLTDMSLVSRLGALICGDTLPTKKPDPAGLLRAYEQVGAAPAACVYVGDDPRDVQAAHAAGSLAVAAGWGYFTEDSPPESWGADVLVDSPQELTRWLGLDLSRSTAG